MTFEQSILTDKDCETVVEGSEQSRLVVLKSRSQVTHTFFIYAFFSFLAPDSGKDTLPGGYVCLWRTQICKHKYGNVTALNKKGLDKVQKLDLDSTDAGFEVNCSWQKEPVIWAGRTLIWSFSVCCSWHTLRHHTLHPRPSLTISLNPLAVFIWLSTPFLFHLHISNPTFGDTLLCLLAPTEGGWNQFSVFLGQFNGFKTTKLPGSSSLTFTWMRHRNIPLPVVSLTPYTMGTETDSTIL